MIVADRIVRLVNLLSALLHLWRVAIGNGLAFRGSRKALLLGLAHRLEAISGFLKGFVLEQVLCHGSGPFSPLDFGADDVVGLLSRDDGLIAASDRFRKPNTGEMVRRLPVWWDGDDRSSLDELRRARRVNGNLNGPASVIAWKSVSITHEVRRDIWRKASHRALIIGRAIRHKAHADKAAFVCQGKQVRLSVHRAPRQEDTGGSRARRRYRLD